MQADDAATDDRDLGRKNARYPAEQDSASAICLLERGSASLDRKPSRDLGHRRKQRQSAALIRHGLIRDRRDAGLEKSLGLFRVRCEVKIGVENLAFAQLRPFGRLRLLDLDDHVRFFEDFSGCRYDPCTGCAIGVVIGPDPCPGLGFHDDLVAVGYIFPY